MSTTILADFLAVPGDSAIQHWLHSLASPWLDSAFVLITDSGDAILIVLITLAVATALARRRLYRQSILLLGGVSGAAALNLLLKQVFQRTRPHLWHPGVVENGFSFPSGHAMASSALAYCVVLLLWPSRWRWWAVGVASVYIVLVGVSRVYLGVHYPSDIVGGWLVSLLWVLLVWRLAPPVMLWLRNMPQLARRMRR